MYSKETVISNKAGLHARPASDFIGCSSKFSSKIVIKKLETEEEANAKSIVMLLSLALRQGDKVEIRATGEDEVEAVEALVALVSGNQE